MEDTKVVNPQQLGSCWTFPLLEAGRVLSLQKKLPWKKCSSGNKQRRQGGVLDTLESKSENLRVEAALQN